MEDIDKEINEKLKKDGKIIESQVQTIQAQSTNSDNKESSVKLVHNILKRSESSNKAEELSPNLSKRSSERYSAVEFSELVKPSVGEATFLELPKYRKLIESEQNKKS